MNLKKINIEKFKLDNHDKIEDFIDQVDKNLDEALIKIPKLFN